MNTRRARYHKKGFTIVELVVVIAVIGILATIVIVSYGAWQTSIQTAQVKNDLTQASTAMQSASSFGSGYPTTLPSSFTSAVGLTTYTSSSGVTTTLYSSTTSTFCIDGVSTANSSLRFYTDETHIKDQSAQAGTCSGRPANSIPAAPTNLAVTSVFSTTVNLSWTAPSGLVNGYLLQCAEDGSFINNVRQVSSTATTGTVTGVNNKTAEFCRVQAKNSVGSGPWSSVVTTNTNDFTAPTGLTTTNQTLTSFMLSWSPNTDAISFTAQCSKDSTFATGILSATTAATSTVFSSLSQNSVYYCRVKLTGSAGDSNWSTTLTTGTNDTYNSLPAGTSIAGYWATVPTGFLPEDGSAVSRTQYADLFAVIGTTYGVGDGSTTFNLPDSRGYTPVNMLTSDAFFGTLGTKTGSKTITLTVNQLPSHNHTTSGGCCNGASNAGLFNLNVNSPATRWSTGSTGGDLAHNNIQPSIVKLFAIKYTLSDATAATLPAGSSIQGYWSSAPTGYLLENGSAVSRTTYSDLFAAIGTTYGVGDGSTTFNIPDSRGRAGVNLSSSDAEFNTMGEKYGEEQHTLTINELPAHSHTAGGGFGAGPSDGGQFRIDVNSPLYLWNNTDNTGGGQPFNDVQPSIVQMSAIKTTPAASSTANGMTSSVAAGTSVSGYWTAPPVGYLTEDGSAVSRSGYAALFAAIGTTYGSGDGSTTFNLPDSRGRVAVNLSPVDTQFNTMGEKYGEKTHVLTIGEMASHSHVTPIGFGAGPANGGQGRVDVNSPQYPWSNTGSAGLGQAFNLIQPSIVKLYVIKY